MSASITNARCPRCGGTLSWWPTNSSTTAPNPVARCQGDGWYWSTVTTVSIPPPWHPRLVAATWAVALTVCAACWWALIHTARRWRRGHR